MDEKSRLTFRISLWRPWLLAIIPLALLAALGVVPFTVRGELASAWGILLADALYDEYPEELRREGELP